MTISIDIQVTHEGGHIYDGPMEFRIYSGCGKCNLTENQYSIPDSKIISNDDLEKLLDIALDNTEDAMNEYYNNYLSGSHVLERHKDGYEQYKSELVFIGELKKQHLAQTETTENLKRGI